MESIHKFDLRQHMLRQGFEIYNYQDKHLGEVELHRHDFYELYYFISGEVDYIVEDKRYHLQKGDMLLISPLQYHQPILTNTKKEYKRIVLWLSVDYVKTHNTNYSNLINYLNWSNENYTNLIREEYSKSQFYYELLKKIMDETYSGFYGSDILCNSYISQLLVEISRGSHVENSDKNGDKKSEILVNNVINYINNNFYEDLSLDLIASKFFISKYYLSHEFNRLVGTSLYRYIINKRLVLSKAMLCEGMTPTKVHQSCGFGDYANFYRAFKAEFGVSPKEFVVMKNT